MESIDFLNKRLSDIFMSLPYLEIRYEFRTHVNTHVIEVKPPHCFERDNDYVNKQIDLEEDFEGLFPHEEIVFLTDNELITIENPILELGVNKDDIAPVELDYDHLFFSTPNEEDLLFDSKDVVAYEINTEIENDFKFSISPPTPFWRNLFVKPKKDSGEYSESFFLS